MSGFLQCCQVLVALALVPLQASKSLASLPTDAGMGGLLGPLVADSSSTCLVPSHGVTYLCSLVVKCWLLLLCSGLLNLLDESLPDDDVDGLGLVFWWWCLCEPEF